MQKNASRSPKDNIFVTSYSEEYEVVKLVSQRNYEYVDVSKDAIHDTIGATANNIRGKKINVLENKLANVIGKYVSEYCVFFDLPTVHDSKQNKWVQDENYVPLILNQDEEVISYIGYRAHKGFDLLLPICKEKHKLIKELFMQVLPEILPKCFPESKDFSWLENDEFKPKEVIVINKKDF